MTTAKLFFFGGGVERETESEARVSEVEVVEVSAAPLASLSLDRQNESKYLSPTLFSFLSPSIITNVNGPSRDLVEHVVAEGQAGVRLECRQGLGPASGQGHLDDGEELRRVRYELRELGGGAHFYVVGLREVAARATVGEALLEGRGSGARRAEEESLNRTTAIGQKKRSEQNKKN